MFCKSSRPAGRAASVPGYVLRNLIALLLIGVLVSGWILYYTMWFPVVGGLLGLGGLFAWAGFLTGILRKELKADLQLRFETAFLARQTTFQGTVGVFVILFLVVSGYGTIEIKSTERQGYAVEIEPASDPRPASAPAIGVERARSNPAYVAPSSAFRKPHFSCWLCGRDYWVTPVGLPGLRVPVRSFRRATLLLPDSFERRPIVLIRPTETMTLNLERDQRQNEQRFDLVVWRNHDEIGRIEKRRYSGETVWVGCDSRVSVPETVAGRLRLEIEEPDNRDDVMALWLSPLAVAERTELEPGETIAAALCPSASAEGSSVAYGFGELKLLTARPGHSFVQVLRLREASIEDEAPSRDEDGERYPC